MRFFQVLLFFTLIFPLRSLAQSDSSVHLLEIDFEYGSRPKRSCKPKETHYFGGLHGGHVSVILDGKSYGFMPTSSPVHIFPKKKRASIFTFQHEKKGDREQTVGVKTLTIKIPLTDAEFSQLDSIVKHYVDSVPYDYAFFGMRCASSTREIIGHMGILKRRKNASYVLGNFYPKRFRKKMIRLAKERKYQTVATNGRDCRKWEKD